MKNEERKIDKLYDHPLISQVSNPPWETTVTSSAVTYSNRSTSRQKRSRWSVLASSRRESALTRFLEGVHWDAGWFGNHVTYPPSALPPRSFSSRSFYYSPLTSFCAGRSLVALPLPPSNLYFLLPRILGIIQRAHVSHWGCTHVPTTCDDDDEVDEDEDDVGSPSRSKSAIKTSRLLQPVLRARPPELPLPRRTTQISASQWASGIARPPFFHPANPPRCSHYASFPDRIVDSLLVAQVLPPMLIGKLDSDGD